MSGYLMARIERVDVEGFKAIRSLSFEPSAINIITGRNNTGKTSLLEAIQVAFDPTSIRTFGPQVDSVLNVDFDRATIHSETSDTSTEVVLYHPDRNRAEDILEEAVIQGFRSLLERLESTSQIDTSIGRTIEDELPEIIADTLDSEVIDGAVERIMIVAIDGTEYEFVHPSGTLSDFFGEVSEKTEAEAIPEEFPDNKLEQDILTGFKLSFGFQRAIERPNFVGQNPPSQEAIVRLDVSDLIDPPQTGNGEVDAVKIDDIEDFLIEKGIVENLRNFDTDYLVFEDTEGEKYSIPYGFMGEGFRGIVGILWQLLDKDISEKVVLIEEPGGRMHPGYVRELVYFLIEIGRASDVQLFITTHNNDFVADFFGENITDEERAFLREEFTLVQLQENAADVMSYEEAEEHLKKLNLDLRGL